MEKSKERFIEIDLIRGFAIALMVVVHLMWDLDYYGLSPLDRQLYWYAQFCPVIFFTLVGICLVLSARHKTRLQLMSRGLLILVIGFIITGISMIVIPDKPVTFGVLHCIGLSIILSALLVKTKINLLYPAIAVICFGFVTELFHTQTPSMLQLILGFHQADLWRYTVDYFPIFPWFGVVLLGMAMGAVLYKDGKRQFPFPDLSKYIPVRMASWLGKYSLPIYLVHQPIIAGTLIYVVPYVTPMLPKFI